MNELAAGMALYGGGTSLVDALALRPSQVEGFYATKIFKDTLKAQESRDKAQAAIINRLNSVVHVLCQLPKALR